MKSNVSKTIAIVIMINLIIGISIVIHLMNKPADKVVQGEADYLVDAKTLWDNFDENEEKANEKYLNKIIIVNGKIIELTESDSLGFTVMLESGGMFNVSCEIPDHDAKERLQVGQTVSVKGLCAGKLMDVVLIKGQIINSAL